MKKGLILALAFSSIFLVGCGETEQKEDPPIAVTVQNVNKEGIEDTNTFSGTTKVKNETAVTVEMGGIIKEMYVDEGQYVNKGDKLLLIKGTEVENSIKQAKSALELAQASYNSTMESTDISISTQQTQLETNLNVAKITYDEAKNSYNIYTKLVESGAMAENDNSYRQIVQAYQKAKESLDSAQKAYDTGIAEGSKDVAKKQLDQAQTSYDIAVSARDKLILYSPVSGVITSKNFNVNETASQAQPAFIISNMDQLEIDLSVTQSDVDKFKKGENVSVIIEDKEYTGVIDRVPTVVNGTNSLYTIEIVMDNNNENLKAGLTAEVELNIEKNDNTITVPKKAVIDEDGEKFVYVVSDDNKSIKTKVQTGIENDDKVQILNGLTNNETIVVGGVSLISDETKIFPVPKED